MATEKGRPPLMDAWRGLLDKAIFIEPEVYALELERIFGRCWLFVGHVSQVPRLGDFVASYLGEVPVLLVRQADASLLVLLNACRHRAHRVCRADRGHAELFRCAQGWEYAIDGTLIGTLPRSGQRGGDPSAGRDVVPAASAAIERQSLTAAAQIDTYKGLVFATLDPDAPPLIEYLGDMAWYLDILLDRREGGCELLAGAHKWVVDCNWKIGADNFSGDMYRVFAQQALQAASAYPGTDTAMRQTAGTKGFQISPGNGHGLGAWWIDQPRERRQSSAVLRAYDDEVQPEAERRLGPVRARNLDLVHGTIFPNLSIHFETRTLRVWQPRRAEKTEVWSYCIVDKDAPSEVKRALRVRYTRSFGPSGAQHQDDVDNWQQVTKSARGWLGRRYPQILTMGLGHERFHEDLPGEMGHILSEINQRALYGHWQKLLSAESWSGIELSPRTV